MGGARKNWPVVESEGKIVWMRGVEVDAPEFTFATQFLAEHGEAGDNRRAVPSAYNFGHAFPWFRRRFPLERSRINLAQRVWQDTVIGRIQPKSLRILGRLLSSNRCKRLQERSGVAIAPP